VPQRGDIVIREQECELIAPLQRQDAGKGVERVSAFKLAVEVGQRGGEGAQSGSGERIWR
jgi:hypothetical protein